jgi:hypothetical protein
MRKSRKLAAEEAGQGGRVLLHLGPGVRQAIEGDEVYFVEAKGDDTEVRLGGRGFSWRSPVRPGRLQWRMKPRRPRPAPFLDGRIDIGGAVLGGLRRGRLRPSRAPGGPGDDTPWRAE